MSMMWFHSIFPEEAANESRTITPIDDDALPRHPFLFVESYCVEPRCDCRRVLISVFDTVVNQPVATISHCLEPTTEGRHGLEQTFLDPLNPQSSYPEALMARFQEMIASDKGYCSRLERHYAMWKRAVDDPCPCGSSRKFKNCCGRS